MFLGQNPAWISRISGHLGKQSPGGARNLKIGTSNTPATK
jgi:hypothetical protein